MDPTRPLHEQPSQADHPDVDERELRLGRDMFLYSRTSGFSAHVAASPDDVEGDRSRRVIGAIDGDVPPPHLFREHARESMSETDFFCPAVIDDAELDLSRCATVAVMILFLFFNNLAHAFLTVRFDLLMFLPV